MRNKETLLLVVIAFVAGLLVGILVSKGSKGPVSSPVATPPAPLVDHKKEIALLEKITVSDPGNREAWVKLGHNYFDSDQPMKAIEAYGKALDIDSNDPDVLTDQGIMFRRVGWFDKAIENFIKASRLDPNHAQSLYNLGIVYRFDLKDFPKAKEAWTKFLSLNPSGPGADQVRAELKVMEAHPGGIPANQ